MFIKDLLVKQEESWLLPPELYSCFNARGLYNPMQFVLRLRPDIHKQLDSIEPGVKSAGELGFESVQAFSTYFHETIHWWQHVGSTLGLMLSLIYPTQTHITSRNLIEFLKDIGPIKSIRKYNNLYDAPFSHNKDTGDRINRILNNWHDIEFFRWLVMDPQKASNIVTSPYFDSVGHSYNIAWASILWLLAATIDRNFDVLPDIRAWEKEFDTLRQKKVGNFYYRSQVRLPPLGARGIFEGQARFSQVQYLYFASEGRMSWDDFESIGMLDGIYKEAFEIYLRILGVSWPKTPGDSLVGLFLLICDIAINPADGFPFGIYHFESFIISVDPGIRFMMLCQLIHRNHPKLMDSIKGYTREEYLEISEILCKLIACKTPLNAAERLCYWSSTHPEFQKLLEEDNTFDFSPENLPVRVFFARYLRFQHDKLKVPEYFCWPGFWSVGNRNYGIRLDEAEQLFKTHSALFVDREDGDVYPRIFSDRDEESVQRTFNSFYSWNAIYDLTRQWIIQDGDFEFNFLWLTSKYSKSETAEWVSNHFENVYGVNPASFKII